MSLFENLLLWKWFTSKIDTITESLRKSIASKMSYFENRSLEKWVTWKINHFQNRSVRYRSLPNLSLRKSITFDSFRKWATLKINYFAKQISSKSPSWKLIFSRLVFEVTHFLELTKSPKIQHSILIKKN